MSDDTERAEAAHLEGLPAHELELGRAVRRLGDLLLSRRFGTGWAGDATAILDGLSDEIERGPAVSKADRLFARNRMATFLETGAWPPPPPDGARLEFDPASVVGGDLNPFGMGARYYREGDRAVGRVTLGHCFEGPPDRVHGGVICAVFDEVMGCVFRATGAPSGFTGELCVRFEAPAPLGAELEFRAWLEGSKGRRQFLAGEAHGPDGRFAAATATFVEMKREDLPGAPETWGEART